MGRTSHPCMECGLHATKTEAEAWATLGSIFKCRETDQMEGKKETDVNPEPENTTLCM